MPQSAYVMPQYRNDPLGFLIALMHVTQFERALRQYPDALPILTGIVTYRCLPRHRAMDVAGMVYRPLRSADTPVTYKPMLNHLYGIISQLPANPYWFAWSLSDAELREHYEQSNEFAQAIEVLGLDFDNVLTVSSIAAGMLSVAQNGVGKAVRNAITLKTYSQVAAGGSRILGASAGAIRLAGIGGAMVAVFAGVMHAMKSREAAQARKELTLRGLMKVEELEP